MRHTHGRIVDITTLPDLDARLAAGARSLEGWRVVGLDLTGRGGALLSRSVASALFLGCTFASGDEEELIRRGAVVFPDLPGSPVDTYRTSLYAPRDLYDARGTRPRWTPAPTRGPSASPTGTPRSRRRCTTTRSTRPSPPGSPGDGRWA